MSANLLIARRLGTLPYAPTVEAMQAFTRDRTPATPDELWLLEHPPVFTLGRAAREGHLIRPGNIPVVRTDRGGQVTYHGPGQLVAYTLIDIARRGLGIRRLVRLLETAVIEMLGEDGVVASTRDGAPGVYVQDRKIAALGLRVSRGRSYHGLSLNVAMDLEPFTRIDPCGFADLEVTQMATLTPFAGVDPARLMGETTLRLAAALTRLLGYATMSLVEGPQDPPHPGVT